MPAELPLGFDETDIVPKLLQAAEARASGHRHPIRQSCSVIHKDAPSRTAGHGLSSALAIDNPQDLNVIGLSRRELARLFAGCQVKVRRSTLAPLAMWLARLQTRCAARVAS